MKLEYISPPVVRGRVRMWMLVFHKDGCRQNWAAYRDTPRSTDHRAVSCYRRYAWTAHPRAYGNWKPRRRGAVWRDEQGVRLVLWIGCYCRIWTADYSGRAVEGMSSPAQTLGSWVRMDICVRILCVCVVLCVGSGIATGWSPDKGVLPTR
jgi:hypothetical protein